MGSSKTQRMNPAFDGGDELYGIGGRFRSSDGVAMMEAVCKGKKSD